jgi:hypothetical protein
MQPLPDPVGAIARSGRCDIAISHWRAEIWRLSRTRMGVTVAAWSVVIPVGALHLRALDR